MVEKTPMSTLWPSLYEPFRQFGSRLAELMAPAAEASSSDERYRISMELPGVAEEDIELTVEDHVVTVRGEKKTEREEKGDTWFFSERQYGGFTRSFRLPPDADESGVTADLRDGVLTVTVPRTDPAKTQSSKRVPISRG